MAEPEAAGSPSEAPGEPEGPPAGVPGRPRAAVALSIALIASLAANGMLAARLRDQQDETNALQNRLEQANARIEGLRGDLRGAGASDPLGRIAARVEKIRGLAFKRPVEPELLAPAAFVARVREAFLRDNDKEEIEASQAVLRTLGLLPESIDLYETLRSVQEEQIAGFYDSDTKKLVVRASDAKDPSPLDQVLLAHELTHALTDQHHDLTRLDTLQDQSKDDEATAFLSVAEGDASLTMQMYQQEVFTDKERGVFFRELQEIETSQLDESPKFLQEALGFPYTGGLDFVKDLHARGGFALVDQAYKDPPLSTEQILHPNRYVQARDDPVVVSLPNVVRALGSGWKSIETGGVGELDMKLLADLGGGQGLGAGDSRDAATGWDGGRYTAARSSEGVVVAVLTAWDSENEAREAARLFEKWLPLRYRNEGSAFDVARGRGWNGREGSGIVVREGARMLLIFGPNEATVKRARGAFDL